MKSTMKILWFVFFLFSHIFVLSDIYAQTDWRNWYCIAWRDTPKNSIKYARQMGYDYIAAKSYYVNTYKNNPDCAGLKYYIIDPYWDAYVYTGIPNIYSLGNNVQRGRLVDATKTYTQDQKNWYNKRMVWKSYDPFPYNLAPSIFPELNPKRFTVVWDLQQRVVINELVEKIIKLFKSYENPNLPFTFMGYGLDVPRLNNEFRYLTSTGAVRTTLAHWTKTDSGLLHDNITHEYATFTEGMYAFYKQLNNRMSQEFPDAKWFIEPARVYDSTGYVSGDEWVYSIKNRADKDELTPDMISQEGPGTDFIDNSSNFNSGVHITKDRVGCSQNSAVEEEMNRLIAGKAGDNGAWYNWFGRFGGSRTMPDFQSIADVYPRLKLIRCIPNWDNLNNVPLLNRSWNGSIYQSPKSYISSDVMYSYHPKTGKVFAVFLTTKGVIKLSTEEKVISVKRADDFFMEAEDGAADVNIVGSVITLKSGVTINVDTSNGQSMGNGYIFTLGSSSDQRGLKVHYPFNEGTGSTAYDASGSGNNGIIINSRWTTGKNGSALSFNGTNSYVSISNSLPAFSEFTCAAWVKTADLAANRGVFTSGGANTSGFRFRVNSTGAVWLMMAGGGSYTTISTATGIIQSGSFYHICVTGKSGQYMRIYVNGALVKEKITKQIINAPTTPGYVGTSWSPSSELMKGIIDNVRIYNRALSDQEVQSIYSAGL